MQETSATFQAVIDRHETASAGGASFDFLELVEIYASDYAIPTAGFDPGDAEERFGGVEGYTFLGLAYEREYVDRGEVQRNVGKKENSVTANFSNVSRALATYIQTNDVEGKWLVLRAVSPFSSTVLADSLVIFCGRMERPGDVGDQTGSLQATQRFGQVNQKIPPRTFSPNDSKGRAPNDPKFEGFIFLPVSGSLSYTERVRRQGFGSLLGLTKKVTHTLQYSSHSGFEAEMAVPDAFGRVSLPHVFLATVDIGGAINVALAWCEGVVHAYEAVRQTNPKFSQPLGLNHRYGYVGGEGPPGRVQTPPVEPYSPGRAHYSRLAHTYCFVTGSTPDVDEAESPSFAAVILAKLLPLPDGSGDFTLEGHTHKPAYIARYLLTDERYCNEGPDSVEDATCIDTAEHGAEYVLDTSQGERTFVHQTDMGLQGTDYSLYRSTGLLDSRRLRIDLGLDVAEPSLILADVEPFDPTDPPIPTDPGDPIAPARTYLRERYTCNVSVTERQPIVDFLYGPLAEAGRLFYRRNGKGRTEILSERPVDNTRLRGAVAAGDTTVKVLDVLPWKTGPRLLKQKLLTGAHLTTSEGRTVTAAAYTSDGNAVTITKSTSGGVTATLSGATFSGGTSSTPATATVTIGGTPAAGNTVTLTINGIAIVLTVDASATTATVAGLLSALVNATPQLAQFVKASWSGSVVTLTCKYGVLTLNAALANAHVAQVANPTATVTPTAAAGGNLPAGTLYLAYAYTNSGGETALSPVMSVEVTAGQKASVPSVTLPAGATGVNWYVSKYTDNGELLHHSSNNGSSFFVTDLPEPTSAIPYSGNTTGEELMRVAAFFACNDQDGSRATGEWIPYPLWQASKAVALNDIYLPTTPNGRKYKVTTAGTAGTSEPSWTLTPGGTNSSGTAVFTEFGPTVLGQAGLIRGNIHANSFKWPLGGSQSNVNQLKGTFYDSKDDFAPTPIEVNDFDHQAQTRKVNSQDVNLSGIDNANQASRQLNFRLSKLRDGDLLCAWSTGPAGIVLEEGDVVCVSADNGGFINLPVRLEQISIGNAPTYTTKLTGRKYSTLMFSDEVRQHSIKMPTTLRSVTPLDTLAQILDLPVWDEADRGRLLLRFVVRAADGQGSWKGYGVYADADDGAGDIKVAEGDVQGTLGELITDLPAASSHAFNTAGSVRVRVDGSKTLQSYTTDEVLRGANLARAGSVLFRFQTATVVSSTDTTTTYDLTGLLIGLYGTEGDAAVAGDDFALLDGAELDVDWPLEWLNREVQVKVATVNKNLADVTAQAVTVTGESLRHPAPQLVKGYRNVAGDTLSDWKAAVQGAGGIRQGLRNPLGDEAERYAFRVMSDDGLTEHYRWEVAPGLSYAPVFWEYVYRPWITACVVSADGSVDIASVNVLFDTGSRTFEGGAVRSAQVFTGEAMLVFKVAADSPKIGFQLFGKDARRDPLSFYMLIDSFGDVYVEGGASPVATGVPGDEFTVWMKNGQVRYYKGSNVTEQSIPIYTSTVAAEPLPYVVVARDELQGSVDAVRLLRREPEIIITAEMQTAAFGGLKNPMRVRVNRISSLVGEGQNADEFI